MSRHLVLVALAAACGVLLGQVLRHLPPLHTPGRLALERAAADRAQSVQATAPSAPVRAVTRGDRPAPSRAAASPELGRADGGGPAPAEPHPLDPLGRRVPPHWADYDPLCARNAALRAEDAVVLVEVLAEPATAPDMRLAAAAAIAELNALVTLDYLRESTYAPDDGAGHPVMTEEGALSIANGGASYVIRPGRFPLLDQLEAQRERGLTAAERTVWAARCPIEAEVLALHDRTMALLASYL